MTGPGPEWYLWAKRLRDDHEGLVKYLENVSRTVAEAPTSTDTADLRSGQQVLDEQVKSLAEQVRQLQTQQQQQASEIASLRAESTTISTTLSQQAQPGREHREDEEVRRLMRQVEELRNQQQQQAAEIASLREENTKTTIAARERERVVAVDEARREAIETGLTTPLNATNLASLPAGSSFGPSMQGYCESSARRDRNTSRQAQRATSSPLLDSEETRGSPQTPESPQSISPSEAFAFPDITSSDFADATPSKGQGVSETNATHLSDRHGRSSFVTRSDISDDNSFVYIQEPETHVEVRNILIPSLPHLVVKPQQSLGLIEYMLHSRLHIEDGMSRYEKQLVEAFVVGMDNEDQKAALRAKVDQQGYTLQVASKEVSQIIQDASKKRKRATATPPPSRDAQTWSRGANGRLMKER